MVAAQRLESRHVSVMVTVLWRDATYCEALTTEGSSATKSAGGD
jgi:hypothetical protein